MTALTQDRKNISREGERFEDPVLAATKVFGGGLVAIDANGWARPAADVAGLIVRGVAQEQVDNLAGANGAKTVPLENGVYQFESTALTIADIGKPMFVSDDQTVVKTTTTNKIVAGILVGIEGATKAWIEVGARAGAAVASVSQADAAVQGVGYIQGDANTVADLANANKVAINAILVALRAGKIIAT